MQCSADTAIINLMFFLIQVVLRSGAEIARFRASQFVNTLRNAMYKHFKSRQLRDKIFTLLF